VFVAATGNTSDAAAVLSTLILAAAFTPVRKSLEAVVDRHFKPSPAPGAAASMAGAGIDGPGSPAAGGQSGTVPAAVETGAVALTDLAMAARLADLEAQVRRLEAAAGTRPAEVAERTGRSRLAPAPRRTPVLPDADRRPLVRQRPRWETRRLAGAALSGRS
jgi:hypothetical protein